MRAIPLALVLTLTLVLVAPLALATCQHCNSGSLTTACALAAYPVEARGMVTMRADRTWRVCYVFYWDHLTIGRCEDPLHYRGTVVVTLIPSEPASYKIGITVEGQYYVGGGGGPIPPPPDLLSSGGGWVIDSSATAIEYCYGFCEI